MCGSAYNTPLLEAQKQQAAAIHDFAKRHNLNPVTLMPLDWSSGQFRAEHDGQLLLTVTEEPQKAPEIDWLAINREMSA